MERRRILLPHSFNPDSVDDDVWEHVVWGEPARGIYGRQAYALKLFLEYHARGETPHIYFGNGSYVAHDGRSEAEYTKDFVFSRLSEIEGFGDESIRKALQESIFIETCFGQNTRGEVVGCFDQCMQKNLGVVVLVTSPFHAPRSLRDALALREEQRVVTLRILAEACDTNPPGCNPSGVDIKEPRHVLL